MAKLCEGRVAIVTGAGRGIGREHALSLARHGAMVVVNDLGADVRGEGGDPSAAEQVVEEIRAAGGDAIVNAADVSDFLAAGEMVQQAIDTYGRLDVLVNNAGILRDRMLANMAEDEWDAVITVHLKGAFAPTRHAAAYWRDRAKAGDVVAGRVINTTSPSGIYGNIGQANYGAAKAGIAAFTLIVAEELYRYGVTVNAIAPAALTRMTENLGLGAADDEVKALYDPRWISPIVTWLASSESANVTGRVFDVSGVTLAVAEGWHRGPSVAPIDDPEEMGPLVADLLAKARLNADMNGADKAGPGRADTTV